MNTIKEFLADLREKNIRVWTDGDQLRYKGPKENLTPAVLCGLKERKGELLAFFRESGVAAGATLPALVKHQGKGPVPMSFAQRRLWFLYQLEGPGATYNIPLAVRLTGPLRVDAMERGLNEILIRHEALRANFRLEDDMPTQVIAAHAPVALPVIDLRALPEEKRTEETRRLVSIEAHRPFELGSGPKLRTSLFRVADEEHVLLFVMHHIASDGWSIEIFYRELAELYGAFCSGTAPELPELEIQYTDYAYSQQEWMKLEAMKNQLAYWERQLAEMPPFLKLPTSRPRPPVQSFRGKMRVFEIPAETSRGLRALSQEMGSTLFMTMLSILAAFLSRYTGREDIPIGCIVANRNHPEVENIIGFFANTLVFRNDLSGDPIFTELLTRVRNTSLDAYGNQDIPFEKLVEALRPERNLGHSPLVQVLLSFIDVREGRLELQGLRAEPFEFEFLTAKCDLNLEIYETGSALKVAWIYNTDLFDESAVSRMVAHFRTLAAAVVENRGARISQLPLLTNEDKRRLTVDWNQTRVERPGNQCIHEMFEAQVKRTPDRLAVVFKGKAITYGELNARANRLARLLREKGVKPNEAVGIMLHRSPDVLVAILGVLKAGGAYLPMEIKYPKTRLDYIFQDSGMKVLLTSRIVRQGHEAIKGFSGEIVEMEEPRIYSGSGEDLDGVNHPTDSVYFIYTSGSTGKPKGVILRHSGVVNYISWARDFYLRGEVLDFPLFSSLSFDLTVTSIYVPLVSGGKVVVYGEHESGRDLAILDVMNENAVDVIKLTPSHLSLVKDIDLRNSRIKKFIVGGEDFKSDLAKSIHDLFRGNIEIYNEYGPTEATVACMIHRFDPEDEAGSVPIGKASDNAQVYILDAHLNLAPVGVAGELYISGAGVAKGYLNKEDLTAAKFISNPFISGAMMYRTGDLAKWRPSGDMEFIGRIDNQVKIRGVRIELDEIEAEILSHEDISECIVEVVESRGGVKKKDAVTYCSRCGLPSNYPGSWLDEKGVCNMCLSFEEYRDKAQQYFKNMENLRELFQGAQATKESEYDCLVLFSGGKDSTYVLYPLVVEMGLKVLAFTLDNFYISQGAKDNIRKVVEELKVDLVTETTPGMNGIFVDSLRRFSNVCNGCFKTIYTLGMNLADRKGIRYIVTGLSRGQLFETRLGELFRLKVYGGEDIDRAVKEARKVYHRQDDAVSASLDVRIFQDDGVFDRIQFIDFFRYSDAGEEEVLAYLAKHAPWIRPKDTGCSTNCLINDVGIYVHQKERGYHNYALPYSWEVRLGRKKRAEAQMELTEIKNVESVKNILDELGYKDNNHGPAGEGGKSLAAYYVAKKPIAVSMLRDHLIRKLPESMVPSYFVLMEKMPLTSNGKVDRQSLPAPGGERPKQKVDFVAPRTPVEKKIADIWAQFIGFMQTGVHDNFFELGGHSLMATQIVSRMREVFQVEIPLRSLFEKVTIAGLAELVEAARQQTENDNLADILSEMDGLSDEEARLQLISEDCNA